MLGYYIVRDYMGVPQIVYADLTPGENVVGSTGGIVQGDLSSGTTTGGLNQQANGLLELANLHNTLLTQNQLVCSGTGDNASAQLPTTVVTRPWLDSPEGSVPFDPQLAVALPAVAGSTVVVTLVVPDGYDGVINAYSWNFTGGGFVQGSGDIQVQILRNGAAVRNYDNILVEKGTIAAPRPISPLRVYSGQILTLVVNHIANALLNGNVVGCFSGYFYPSMS
jgi:hypothetical protein